VYKKYPTITQKETVKEVKINSFAPQGNKSNIEGKSKKGGNQENKQRKKGIQGPEEESSVSLGTQLSSAVTPSSTMYNIKIRMAESDR
jgi:hypothetical protein